MKHLDYQKNAITELKQTSDKLLSLQGSHSIVFKAPTGSGKTVMMAEFLKNFVNHRNDSKEFSFIWTAPKKLHIQSKNKLAKHFEDSMSLKCSGFEDLSDKMIGLNEILFLNWESINKKKNIFYRENEQEFYLEKVIENTKDDGRTLILIIDESHHTAGSDNTQELIRLFNAKLTIEVSATPKITGDESVTVYREKVVEEQMIKKEIAINPGFKNTILQKMPNGDVKVQSDAEESTNEFVIRNALENRENLVKQYSEEDSPVNPLMLIQLPDRRKGQEDVLETIKGILNDNHNITIDNGRLAIYLSENKENLANISKNDSQVEVMIFKQAIALGWDCPRASILVLFRDWKSMVFSIQTVGRIMRMPELKHYSNDDLNVGYIYTNLSDISIHQDIADGYAKVFHSKRNNEVYEEIELLSCHSVRHRETTRLTPNFVKLFLESANELDLKNQISIDIEQIANQLITDGIVTDPDKEFEHLQGKQTDAFDYHSGETVERRLNEEDIQEKFNTFCAESLQPELHPEVRSVGYVKTAIGKFFHYEFLMKYQTAGIGEQMVVLAKNNSQQFLNVINLTKEKYLADVKERDKELAIDENWEIPKFMGYTDNYVEKEFSLSVMQPFYEYNKASGVEKNFAKFLDEKENEIKWWYKNGERDGTFFAVPRKNGEDDVPFYVDWIMKFKDGRIGLFDTKGGLTAETAGSRAKGLAKYIKEQNENGGKLFGGIVIEKEGSFWINSNEEYTYDENNLLGSGWKVFT